MGRHRSKRQHTDQQETRRDDRQATGTVDPENTDLVEPDRDAAERLSADEREKRRSVHTQRDPADDMHLAAADARDTEPGP